MGGTGWAWDMGVFDQGVRMGLGQVGLQIRRGCTENLPPFCGRMASS